MSNLKQTLTASRTNDWGNCSLNRSLFLFRPKDDEVPKQSECGGRDPNKVDYYNTGSVVTFINLGY